MKVLFLMLSMQKDPKDSNLYSDLAFEYSKNGHDVTIMAASPNERHSKIDTINGCRVVWVKSMRQKGVKSVLRKGLAQVLLPFQFKRVYRKFLKNDLFDVVFMPTPPITLTDFACHIKKKTGAKFYLILRDIYPQGAADLGLVKGRLMYDYLKRQEHKTYETADIIGCMSQGNVDYILDHNPWVEKDKMKLLPNWQKDIGPIEQTCETEEILDNYDLKNKFLILFGGTIGYAQKIENIVKVGELCRDFHDIRVVVVGEGVEKHRLQELVENCQLQNIVFMERLPRQAYLNFAKSCDVGLITIDDRFTVPTIPSKTVAYFNLGLPVIAIVDSHTDFPKLIESSKAGYSVIGQDWKAFESALLELYHNSDKKMEFSSNALAYFKEHMTVEKAFELSSSHLCPLLNEK